MYQEREFSFDPESCPLVLASPVQCELVNSIWRAVARKKSAKKFRQVLMGGTHSDAKRDSIVLNAGMGCYVYGLTDSIEEGCKLARTTLESGKATELLQEWIKVSQAVSETISA